MQRSKNFKGLEKFFAVWNNLMLNFKTPPKSDPVLDDLVLALLRLDPGSLLLTLLVSDQATFPFELV